MVRMVSVACLWMLYWKNNSYRCQLWNFQISIGIYQCVSVLVGETRGHFPRTGTACEPHTFKKIQYKGIRAFIVMHCLRNMYSDAAISFWSPEEHLTLSKSVFFSGEGHSGCKSKNIEIRSLKGNVLGQMCFK